MTAAETAGQVCTRRPGANDTACRCSQECRDLANAARQRRARRQERNVPGRVSAQRVRLHIQAFLRSGQGLSMSDLAKEAGVSRRTVELVMASDPDRLVNLSTARKVLSVPIQAGQRLGSVSVCGVGARRRVEALMVLGWPLKYIAAQAGVRPTTLSRANLVPSASAATVAGVERVFRDLRYRVGPSEVTRSKARSLGFLPWAAWSGSLDDPAAGVDLNGMDPAWVRAYQARCADLSLSRPLLARSNSKVLH